MFSLGFRVCGIQGVLGKKGGVLTEITVLMAALAEGQNKKL